ncbi:MAG: 3-deoxy-D-manno-octulosonic acid transferase [Gammaproteobacteria bacterium]
MSLKFYQILGFLILPLVLLRILFKGFKNNAYWKRIPERFGFYSHVEKNLIWIHCVSVGEFMAAKPLINKYLETEKLLITCYTPTGYEAINQAYGKKVIQAYCPVDIRPFVTHFIKTYKPKKCILLETEIWPNIIHELSKNKIPINLVNARLSQKSFNSYQKFLSNILSKTLNKIDLIAAQNEDSKKRLVSLGAKESNTVVTGNIKFDQKIDINQSQLSEIKKFIQDQQVVVFASTHNDEEKQIFEAIENSSYLKNALKIIIPRHPERFNEVYKLAKKYGYTSAKRSEKATGESNLEVLIGDSMGELPEYLFLADVVFMGGSLVKHGGHNMIEPALLEKPIIYGQHVFNFAQISKELINSGGAIQVDSADTLVAKIESLLNNPKEREELSKNAYKFAKNLQGSTNKLFKLIK